ncbi:MAG: hypothetical protein ACI32N_03370 [Bulleidia sp.]
MNGKAAMIQKIIEHGFDITTQNRKFIISYRNLYYFEVNVSGLIDSIILYELSHAIHEQAGTFEKLDCTSFIQRANSKYSRVQAYQIAEEIECRLKELDRACHRI